MKVIEIISENTKRKALQKFTGLFMGLSRKQVVEKIAQQWARDIENAAARGIPARLSNPSKSIPEKFRGDSTILSDARSMANKMVGAKVGGAMFQGWNSLMKFATLVGLGNSFVDLVVGLWEDAGNFKGQDFQQAAQTRIDRFVGEAMAIITAATASYFLKLPKGFQSWFGWVPGVTAVTNLVAAMGPTAVAALNVWIATPEGKKMIAEFFAYNSLANSTLQPLRAYIGGVIKGKTQPLIDKLQDFQDPEGAAGREPERADRAAKKDANAKARELKIDFNDPANRMADYK